MTVGRRGQPRRIQVLSRVDQVQEEEKIDAIDVRVHVVDPMALLRWAEVRLRMAEERLRIAEVEVIRVCAEGDRNYGFMVCHLNAKLYDAEGEREMSFVQRWRDYGVS